jgi:hypothetical protein
MRDVREEFPYKFHCRDLEEMTGELGERESREKRSENEGVTGGGRIYFGRRD